MNNPNRCPIARDVRILQITACRSAQSEVWRIHVLQRFSACHRGGTAYGTAGTRTRLRTFLLRIQCSPTSKLCSCADPASHIPNKTRHPSILDLPIYLTCTCRNVVIVRGLAFNKRNQHAYRSRWRLSTTRRAIRRNPPPPSLV